MASLHHVLVRFQMDQKKITGSETRPGFGDGSKLVLVLVQIVKWKVKRILEHVEIQPDNDSIADI